MKCNQSRPGFKLVSPFPFLTTITITPRAQSIYPSNPIPINLSIYLSIFRIDSILFSNYFWELVNILIYSTKYSEIMPFLLDTFNKTNSSKIVHARYRRKFNFNKFPNGNQIFNLVKNFRAHGICADRWATVPSTERRKSGACNLGPLLTFVAHV